MSKISTSCVSHCGCHSCAVMATMAIKSYSTCLQRPTQIYFTNIKLTTRSIILRTTTHEFEIQFRSEIFSIKCSADKICLSAKIGSSCEQSTFCLCNPELHLASLNSTHSESNSLFTSGDISFTSLVTSTSLFLI